MAGCIGLRKIDRQNCEVKRLYVRLQFRGNHIGDQLIRTIIEDSRQIGYSHMLLDTLPFLKNAIHMYRMYGFYEIESYNNSPMDTSIYMLLDLKNIQKRITYHLLWRWFMLYANVPIRLRRSDIVLLMERLFYMRVLIQLLHI